MRKSRFLSRVLLSAFVAAAFATAAEAAPQGCAPPGTWATRTSYTNTISRAWGAFYPPDGKFYLMGGRPDDVAGDDFIQVHIYDPATDTWAESNATFADNQNNNMVGGVLDFGGQQLIVTVGGSAAGGTTSSSNVQTYDPVGDSLQVLTNDPWPGNTDGAILPGGAAVYENKLYVFGGFDIGIGMVDTITVFDPSATEGSRWSTSTATLPVARGYIPTSVSGGLIYLMGGSTWDDVNLTILDSAESSVYDPDADTIAAVTTPIPRATAETRAVTQLDGTVWVLGGGRDAPNPSNEVDVYDPGTDTWSLGPAFTAARRNFAADIDPATGNIWATGGYDTDGVTLLSVNEQFTACNPITDRIFADGFDGPPPP
jgi:N-acetylneuraminic acid mutarotase